MQLIACMHAPTKVDLAHAREVQPSEGHELAQRHGCLFAETSAKTDLAVAQAFEELLLKVGCSFGGKDWALIMRQRQYLVG